MINPKDYEGHTPGPWSKRALYLLFRYANKHSGPWNDDEEISESEFMPYYNDDSDMNLISDAPTILAELVAERNKVCEWEFEEAQFCGGGWWWSSCLDKDGNRMAYTKQIKPGSDGFTHCPGCGGRIKVVES